jgi:WD40 repeat protein
MPEGRASSPKGEDEPLRILRGHRAPVISVEFNRSGAMLCSGSHDGTVALWDVKSWTVRYRLESISGSPVWSCHLSSDSSLLAMGCGDGRFFVKQGWGNWGEGAGEANRVRYAESAVLRGARFRFNMHYSQCRLLSRLGSIDFWDPVQGSVLLTFKGHDSYIMGCGASLTRTACGEFSAVGLAITHDLFCLYQHSHQTVCC